MNANRESIIRKIRALRERTTANGCTEAEALSAAEVASRLAEEYQVDMSETEIEEEGIEGRTIRNDKGRTGRHEASWAVMAVAKFCDVRCWGDRLTTGEKAVRFYGLKSDVDMAEWLFVTVRSTMERSFLAWYMTEGARSGIASRTARASFMLAMGARISRRLNDLTDARRPARATTGRELVAIKDALIVAGLKAMGYPASLGAKGVKRSAGSTGDATARAAGSAAGDRVGFGRPVGSGAGAVAAIGYRA